jgi:hypothetical protein
MGRPHTVLARGGLRQRCGPRKTGSAVQFALEIYRQKTQLRVLKRNRFAADLVAALESAARPVKTQREG